MLDKGKTLFGLLQWHLIGPSLPTPRFFGGSDVHILSDLRHTERTAVSMQHIALHGTVRNVCVLGILSLNQTGKQKRDVLGCFPPISMQKIRGKGCSQTPETKSERDIQAFPELLETCGESAVRATLCA